MKRTEKRDKKDLISVHLGSFLKNQTLKNVEIYFLTGIPRNRLTTLTKPGNDSLTADEFYLIALATESDLDSMADYLFSDYTVIKKEKGNSLKTKFDNYLYEVLNTQKDLSLMTGLSETRISILRNDPNAVIQASDLYLVAKSLNRKVSEAFKVVCGHLQLNTVAEQERLKGLYKAYLLEVKIKRDNG